MRRFLALMLMTFAAGTLQAQSPEQLLRQANSLYQQGKITEARDIYESIARAGYVSGELFYNLGNAYYRIGDIPRAILNFERAKRITPDDDDLRHNLQLANMMITDRIEPTPRLFVWEYWDAIKDWFSMRGATLMAYCWFVVVLAAAAAFVLARTYALRKIAALAGGGAMVLLLFFVIVFVAKIRDAKRDDEAVIMTQIVTVKNSPDAKSSDAFVLHGGLKVQIIDHLGAWSKIRLADGKVGWMEASAVETI